ncbi:MAG: prepilin-type N-terminal cleavage/methylation domain-containing protein [Vicinamibacterales bacterium]
MSNERGFTLAEVLVASLILTVSLVALGELLAVSTRLFMLGRESTEAVRLAQDKIEELAKADFDTTPGLQLTGANSLDSDVANYFDTPAVGYTRRWQVDAGPDANPSLRQVTVRVIPTLTDRRVAAPVEIVTIVRKW